MIRLGTVRVETKAGTVGVISDGVASKVKAKICTVQPNPLKRFCLKTTVNPLPYSDNCTDLVDTCPTS
jgi:hypothetical protein